MANESVSKIAQLTDTDGATNLYPYTVPDAIVGLEDYVKEHGSTGGSSKRTCSYVIGTSTAGWTNDDCDYLCDGTSDEVEIMAAANALPDSGGELVILSGTYNLGAIVDLPEMGKEIIIRGNYNSTILKGNSLNFYGNNKHYSVSIEDLTLDKCSVTFLGVKASLRHCILINNRVMISNFHDYVSDFICSDNKCIRTIAFTDGSSTINVTDTDSYDPGVGSCHCCISNNILYTSIELFNSAISVIGRATVNGNYIFGKYGLGISAEGVCSISGNYLLDSGIRAMRNSSVTGNSVVNANISGYGYVKSSQDIDCGVTVSGNMVRNGCIRAEENCIVSGNNIIAPSNDCSIFIARTSNNAPENISPVIIGNNCAGGAYGIFLAKCTYSIPNQSFALISGNRCQNNTTACIKVNSTWHDCVISQNMCIGSTIVDEGINNKKEGNILV